MNYESLNEFVESKIKTNGKNEITGLIAQTVIKAVIRELGVGYQFAGVATSETTPPETDARIFYLCGAGDYSQFGDSFEVENGSIGVLAYSDEWRLATIAIGSSETPETELLIESFDGETLQAEVGKYYNAEEPVENLTITLPAISDLTKTKSIMVCLTGGTTPNVQFVSADSKPISYYDGFNIESGVEYELNIMFTGSRWVVAYGVIASN